MSKRIVVIGAGMGGLTAALRLARTGYSVQVLEARASAGGLTSAVYADGFAFDGGPYILLDRRGLEWAFQAVGLELSAQVALRRIEDVYVVESTQAAPVHFYADLAQTAAGLKKSWPGSGKRYERFVQSTARTYRQLERMLTVSRPGPAQLLRQGAWRAVPFLLQPLGALLARTGLPPAVCSAIGIWTQVAGQTMSEAPSLLAFVPSLIHTAGAYYPAGGIQALPDALVVAARAAGVAFRFSTKVCAIRCERGRVSGVESDGGETIVADAVVSNASGIGTYLELLQALPGGGRPQADRAPVQDTESVLPATAREGLTRLPLQSPGVCAYLAVRGITPGPYLRFYLPAGGRPQADRAAVQDTGGVLPAGGRPQADRAPVQDTGGVLPAGALCRLLVVPSALTPGVAHDGWQPMRLNAPMDYEQALRVGEAGQREYLEEIIAGAWWRTGVEQVRVLATHIPAAWGAQYHLYRDGMNPVMTARFMRAGRMAHRSPYVRGLYLAGSATHPGQWVSFCAISGVLAADCAREDLG